MRPARPATRGRPNAIRTAAVPLRSPASAWFPSRTCSRSTSSRVLRVLPALRGRFTYPAQLTVAGRGVISIDVATASDCAEEGIPLLSSPQTFTITGGTGAFAGASGNGVVTRTGTGCCPGFAMDNWDGKVGAPGLIVDLTPPTITGAVDKLVRAPRYRLVRVSRTRTKRVPVTSVRVTYHVSAADDLDGTVPVTCSPSSGSRFHVGRTRTVTCSATDKSANALTAQFNVTIKRK